VGREVRFLASAQKGKHMGRYTKLLERGEMACVTRGYGPHTHKGFYEGSMGLVIKREGVGYLFLACPRDSNDAKLIWLHIGDLERLNLE
jgi:hypothetical protein